MATYGQMLAQYKRLGIRWDSDVETWPAGNAAAKTLMAMEVGSLGVYTPEHEGYEASPQGNLVAIVVFSAGNHRFAWRNDGATLTRLKIS